MKRVILSVFGLYVVLLLIPTLVVLPAADQKEAQPVSSEAEEGEETVRVLRSDTDKVEEIPLEEYVTGVVASEMPVTFEMEALKAQALAARTYIMKHKASGSTFEGADVTDTVQHQVYKDEQQLREIWKDDYEENRAKVEEAVQATKGEIITYKEEPITAAFFSTSNGYTENSGDYWEHDIPYLKSVISPWDKDAPTYLDQVTLTQSELMEKLTLPTFSASDIELSRTEGERVETMTIGEKTFTGRDIREKLGLKSSDFSIEQKGDHFIFTTRGFGHGVGMSQYGANGLASEGKSYKDIIAHYYSETKIEEISSS
ncbi:stage II sporulation protein D [Salimicrobium halophilum]|uniref:Stage II sporulation protein D n=1 Tax=Salimicrobium halophilum TaxID=86666 RepID=A0A1G8SG54_9BACI|nr:stage II sporulation protein D [Salimicrobium halophilum]SDJ28177.1 stage II sporulation protein D [Salimicrobium halophilum]